MADADGVTATVVTPGEGVVARISIKEWMRRSEWRGVRCAATEQSEVVLPQGDVVERLVTELLEVTKLVPGTAQVGWGVSGSAAYFLWASSSGDPSAPAGSGPRSCSASSGFRGSRRGPPATAARRRRRQVPSMASNSATAGSTSRPRNTVIPIAPKNAVSCHVVVVARHAPSDRRVSSRPTQAGAVARSPKERARRPAGAHGLPSSRSLDRTCPAGGPGLVIAADRGTRSAASGDTSTTSSSAPPAAGHGEVRHPCPTGSRAERVARAHTTGADRAWRRRGTPHSK